MKDYFEPMHTTEHILNATMVRMFGCRRSQVNHIERKKSKCDYYIHEKPSTEQIAEIETRVNDVIDHNVPVNIEMRPFPEAEKVADLRNIPEDVKKGDIRLVIIGNYDVCACIGKHVSNTSEIAELGHFKIVSDDFSNGRWRVRFKLQ